MTDKLPVPKISTACHVDKTSPDVGVSDKLDNFPINEFEYRAKTDFKSYFNIIGVPYCESERFHVKIINRDIKGALMSIRHSFRDPRGRVNLACIFRHIVNAVERRDNVTVYRRKVGQIRKKKTSINAEIDGLAFREKQKRIKSNAQSFIERMREPVYTIAQAKAHISALR